MNPYRFSGDRETIQRYQSKYAQLFKEGERVLDLGCGEGFFLELLRARGVTGVGVDAFLQAVIKGQERGLDVRHSDALAFINSTEERFDGVFMAHVIEHLRPEDVEGLFHRCHQILKRSGRLIVITPNAFDLEVLTERFWLDLTHKRLYPAKLLEALAKEAAFEILSVGDDPDARLDPRGFSLPAKARYWLNKLRLGEFFGRGDMVVIAAKPQ